MDIGKVHISFTPSVVFEGDYVNAFNAWIDDYINNPKAFKAIEDSAMEHLSEKLGGKEPSYGEACTATLLEYLKKTKEETQ